VNGKVRPRLASRQAHVAVGNQLLDLGTRVAGENADEKTIEPLPLGFR
jgi:hypothetical protein